MKRQFSIFSILLFGVFVFVSSCQGCGAKIPDSPEGTVDVVAKEIEKGNPQIVWEALPPSYQQDINGLVQQAAGKFDKELWDKGVSVLKKGTDIAGSKKEFILGTPMMGQLKVDQKQLAESWDAVVGLLKVIAESELASVDDLKKFDGGKFLSGTGKKLVEKGKELRKLAPEDAPKSFADLKVEKVSESGDKASLKVTVDGKTDTVEMVKVEGRWVPAEMAKEWKEMIAEAKKSIEEMSTETMAKQKPQLMMMMAGIEAGMDQLKNASSQAEFDTTVQGLFMGMMPH
ncbi:MAG: hypothetical protein JXR76_31435 [Deltaproteobacteria bacterium]|nr:hypothetical protein [Deltaproteobacteria bacterium]